MMKYIFYRIAFVVLGVFLAFLGYILLALRYTILTSHPTVPHATMWLLESAVRAPMIFVLVGFALGLWQGGYWWPRLYDRAGRVRYPRPWRI